MAAVREYAVFKRTHLDTERHCAEAGIKFVPFILEAEGGAGPDAAAVLSKLYQDAALRAG